MNTEHTIQGPELAAPSDYDLLSRFQTEHDPTAFEAFVKCHQAEATRAVIHQGVPPQDAPDIVQEAALKLWLNMQPPADASQKPPKVFTPEDTPGAYFYTIARRTAINHHRRNSTRPLYPIPDYDDYRDNMMSHDRSPEEVCIGGAVRALLLQRLRSIPERQEEVLRRRYLLDETIADCAAAMGITERAVKSLTQRGIALMRARVRDLY